jgi:hypothetical protein
MTRRATPDDYKLVFEDSLAGQAVLEDLIARFGGAPYVKGGHEGDRETCFRAGKLEVVNFVVAQINRSNGVNDETQNVEVAE